jgi:hypothetical protein
MQQDSSLRSILFAESDLIDPSSVLANSGVNGCRSIALETERVDSDLQIIVDTEFHEERASIVSHARIDGWESLGSSADLAVIQLNPGWSIGIGAFLKGPYSQVHLVQIRSGWSTTV